MLLSSQLFRWLKLAKQINSIKDSFFLSKRTTLFIFMLFKTTMIVILQYLFSIENQV
jgi:hypothetical protein